MPKALAAQKCSPPTLELVRERQGGQPRAFKPRIEIEAQLARHVEIGALPGRNDDAIDGAEDKPSGWQAPSHDESAAVVGHFLGMESFDELEAFISDELLEITPQLATRGELVVRATAEDARKVRAADSPRELQAGIGFGEPREIEQRIRGPMTAADNGDGKVFDALAHALSFVLRFDVAALPVAGPHTAGAPAQQFSVRKPSSAFICSYRAA
jgi:hypothetical protein